MNLVRHLLAADARHLRSSIAAWIGLLLILTVMEGARPFVEPAGAMAEWMSVAARLLSLVYWLLFAIVAAAAVQTHTLVGTTAFWFTKPIPPRTLLASKLWLLCLVFIVVPAVCDVLLLLPYHVPPLRILLVVLQGALVRGVVSVAFMCVAALTPNLTRFALVWVGTLFAAALFSALSIGSAFAGESLERQFGRMQGGGPVFSSSRLADWTPEILGALLFLGAAFALLRSQYGRRSVRRSALVGLAGLLAAALVTTVWPWRIFVPRQTVPSWATAETPTLMVDSSTFRFSPGSPVMNPAVARLAHVRAQLSTIPADWYATVRLMRATLAVPEMPSLSSPGYGYSAPLFDATTPAGPLVQSLRTILGVSRIEAAGGGGIDSLTAFIGRQGDLASRAGRPMTYDGRFTIDLTQLNVAATLQVGGAAFQDEDFRIVLEDLKTSPYDDGAFMRARISSARTIFDRRPPSTYLYFLRNRAKDQALGGFETPVNFTRVTSLFNVLPASPLAHGFDARIGSIRFGVPDARRDLAKGVQPEWLQNAELVIVKATGSGQLTREIHLSGLTLELPTIPPRRQ